MLNLINHKYDNHKIPIVFHYKPNLGSPRGVLAGLLAIKDFLEIRPVFSPLLKFNYIQQIPKCVILKT